MTAEQAGGAFLTEDVRDEGDAMDSAPEYAFPFGSMPESTDEEGQDYGGEHSPFLGSAPSKCHWKEDVVVHPSIQADVPPIPEFRNTLGEEGHLEIAHESNTEEHGRTNCDVRVSGKVTVNLEGEANQSHE